MLLHEHDHSNSENSRSFGRAGNNPYVIMLTFGPKLDLVNMRSIDVRCPVVRPLAGAQHWSGRLRYLPEANQSNEVFNWVIIASTPCDPR